MKTQAESVRSSNLELLRIVSMLLIIAHHLIINSGVCDLWSYSAPDAKMVVSQIIGGWGKLAINCFVLISGYFMCQKNLTSKRYLKVFLEAEFYKYLLFVVLFLAGYETLSAKRIFLLLFGFLKSANKEFTASFLVFYLFVPFYNLLLKKLTKTSHAVLCLMLLFFHSICATFFFNAALYGMVTWFIVLYFVAAYFRLYPCRWTESKKTTSLLFAGSVVLSVASILFFDFVAPKFGVYNGWYMLMESNKLFAVTTSISAFLFFKNLSVPNSKFINSVASTCFGVLCIHAASDAMRQFLWYDFLKVTHRYELPLGQFVLLSLVSVIGIFAVCSAIDWLRIRFLEKPVLQWAEKRVETAKEKIMKSKIFLEK